jgi:predicted ABC-type ATPase
MPIKRLRIFAGPNGSGKTTIINNIKKKISFGAYVNADDIEKTLLENGSIDLNDFNLKCTNSLLNKFLLDNSFSKEKLKNYHPTEYLFIKRNKLFINNVKLINSYLAADIAEFIRQSLVQQSQSFSYETVMSHHKKITFINEAKQKGYKIYLYFIATEDPEININRVKVRVALKGHNVSSQKITERYYRSLENLKDAIKVSDRAYVFDNSGKVSRLIAEITNGAEVEIIDEKNIPNWFIKYIFD